MTASNDAPVPAPPASGAAGPVAVFASPTADEHTEARANALACHLGAPLVRDTGEIPPSSLMLRVDGQGLSLAADGMMLQPDFSRLRARLKPQRLSGELLVQAARMKGTPHPTALDATAGLGEDALLLAAAGFTVELFESDPVIAALLADALARAAGFPDLAPIVGRMHLHEADSIEALRSGTPKVDVVYLDPMFPERQKNAATKKKFQLLHRLERPCADEEVLLAAALAAHPTKVVIKRPAKGAPLAGRAPAYSRTGKAVRFDVVLPAQLPPQ